jgi:hypothetical protein
VAALPVAAEIDARLVLHRERDDPINLAPIRVAPVILPPCRFLREADQIRNVVVADLCPAHAREETFGGIRVDIVFAAQALRLLMVDPVQLVTGMRTFP